MKTVGICFCGDYQDDHENRTGRCKFNFHHIPGSHNNPAVALLNRCDKYQEAWREEDKRKYLTGAEKEDRDLHIHQLHESCTAAGAELTRLRAIAARAEDVKKIEDIIEEHLAMTLGIPAEWYEKSHVGEVSAFASAIAAYLKGM